MFIPSEPPRSDKHVLFASTVHQCAKCRQERSISRLRPPFDIHVNPIRKQGTSPHVSLARQLARSPRRPRGLRGNVPVQNSRSEWPRGAASAQEDVPNHLRVRLSLCIARKPDAASRTPDRERDDLAGVLARLNACREEGTVGKIRAREEGIVDRAACLPLARIGANQCGFGVAYSENDLRWQG